MSTRMKIAEESATASELLNASFPVIALSFFLNRKLGQ